MTWFTALPIKSALYALCILIIGWIVAKRVSKITKKLSDEKFSKHVSLLLQRVVYYVIFIGFLIAALQQLGFNLTVLIGAAGVFTVAIGFASQTAASNLISGFFMIFERPFSIGDFIEIKGISGTVEAIDLLSTKLRTNDNRMVRIPNETMIKSEICNLNYFPTRRLDIDVGISYDNDVDNARRVCLNLAKECPEVLATPEPGVRLNKFADSSVEIKLMVWVTGENYIRCKSQLQESIKRAFKHHNIEIPYPHLTLKKES